MTPAPGERLLRFVGDKVRFALRLDARPAAGTPLNAFLRTNLGRAAVRRREIIAAHAGGAVFAGASWRDLPMKPSADGWEIELPLAEVGYFKAKPYLLDEKKWQHWPEGSDVGISVHPDFSRTANTIYCAFTRLFGPTRQLAQAPQLEISADGYTIIPPSGTFRDLARQLPFIVQELGCRVLHLLPIHPTPTTYARFGHYGSPYAALDLTAVDPALVEFDKRTTGIDQFCELAYTTHSLGARLFIDIVINHTGWGSTLQENHPEYFLQKPDGEFASPGAWGVTWEDLVELKQDNVALWDIIADALLTWCRRGVDGFRCDAGYKIPVVAWQYIVARVQDEFPETIFLLEGLGGPWEATEALLTEGGMQWAYSELFQNYSGRDVAWYLDYANRQSEHVGRYVHYSETHDNDRLAARKGDAAHGASDTTADLPVTRQPSPSPGKAWSLLRNRLCALASPGGGFGFTCGVEWLAAEKIRVHGCAGLNWGGADNIVPELARLNQLISDHPCFFDGTRLTRLSDPTSPVYALQRDSADGEDSVLVLVNTDAEKQQSLSLSTAALSPALCRVDLLGQALPEMVVAGDEITFTLEPAAAVCLAPALEPIGLSGDAYRAARARAAFALDALDHLVPLESVDCPGWQRVAEEVDRSPAQFLAHVSEFAARRNATAFQQILAEPVFPRVVTWTLIDARRVTPVPDGHWLLIEDPRRFRATLRLHDASGREETIHVQSIPAGNRQVACFPPPAVAGDAELTVERYATTGQKLVAAILFLPAVPGQPAPAPQSSSLVLMTNGRGGMARIPIDLGRVFSKYDCVLAANLNPSVPVDRHVFVKRLRAWVNADGFLSPLAFTNLVSFQPGPPATWNFVANAGDGRTVDIELRAQMLPEKNTVVFAFSRSAGSGTHGKPLPPDADVRLTLRFDIEDRSFHAETKRNGGADYHFSANSRALDDGIGFEFTPATDRQLRVAAEQGVFHPEPEWCENIPHPVEQSRGQVGSGDAYSPGWFELPLGPEACVRLVATAEAGPPPFPEIPPASADPADFGTRLARAARQFVAHRGSHETVIAGYPWFLDWGRDSLIAVRGLLSAGLADTAREILLTFAQFEKNGTLPNSIAGDDDSNRDTSDAPLWFALACEELSALRPKENFYAARVDENRRTIRDVLESIAENYLRGTPNGIRVDPASGLVWSPSHFTWMDTNFPAGTPREGYPVEIQALWIHLLRSLANLASGDRQKWSALADRAAASFEKLFWLEDQGWFADVLLAKAGQAAGDAVASDALRSNCLFAVSLGLANGDRARRCVEAAQRYLVVPGACRSLAPLPVSVPLPVWRNGQLLNKPSEPYWPRYEGDEDTRRKPAYHNGTAWTWTYATFCEALARAWDYSPAAVAAAKSYLSGAEKLLETGCLGQIPEILDGDAPHPSRGCDAQAWSATETLRVWKLLQAR